MTPEQKARETVDEKQTKIEKRNSTTWKRSPSRWTTEKEIWIGVEDKRLGFGNKGDVKCL